MGINDANPMDINDANPIVLEVSARVGGQHAGHTLSLRLPYDQLLGWYLLGNDRQRCRQIEDLQGQLAEAREALRRARRPWWHLLHGRGDG